MKFDYTKRENNPDTAYASMFGIEANTEMVRQIPIEALHEYPNQPFKPYTDTKLQELAADIATNGILNPLCVRVQSDGYQILAGHNRCNAARLAGLSTVPCIVKDVDDDMAAVIVTTTNLNQRDELLPSEKAFAYKMQLDAIKHQGERTDLTSRPIVGKSDTTSAPLVQRQTSREIIAEKSGESREQIRRYIRLTFLNPTLLKMVDDNAIPFRAGVNLSYHHAIIQQKLVDFVEINDIQSISLKQSEAIKAKADLPEDFLKEIFGLALKKAKAVKRVGKASVKTLERLFSDTEYSDEDIADIIEQAIQLWREKGD